MNELIKKSVHITRDQDIALNLLALQRKKETGRKPTSRDLFLEGLNRIPGYIAIHKELIQRKHHAKQDNQASTSNEGGSETQ